MMRPLRLRGGRQGVCADPHCQLGRAEAKVGQEGPGERAEGIPEMLMPTPLVFLGLPD